MTTQQDRADAKAQTHFRQVSWSALVKRVWGAEYSKPDVVYNFSNGRQFLSTDRDESGVYKRS